MSSIINIGFNAIRKRLPTFLNKIKNRSLSIETVNLATNNTIASIEYSKITTENARALLSMNSTKNHYVRFSKTKTSTIQASETTKAQEEEISKKIRSLEKIFPKTTENIFFLPDGKEYICRCFNGSQLGSNPGFYAQNLQSKELFYVKFGKQSKTEVLASKLYRLAGLDVPELKLFTNYKLKEGILSKYIPDLQPIRSAKKGVEEAFGMDALLANWDSVCSNNAVTDGKKIYRIDLGGTFDFRAQGDKKPFGNIVEEITTLINPYKNYISSEIFSEMTRETMLKSIRRVTDLKDADIAKLIKEENLEEYTNTVLKRKKFLTIFADIADKIPQEENMSLVDYNKMIKDKTIENLINSCDNKIDLESIKKSVDLEQNPLQRKKFQNLIENKLEEIEIYIKNNSPLEEEKAIMFLKQNGMHASDKMSETLVYTPTREQRETIQSIYNEEHAQKIIRLLERPLNVNDTDFLIKLINIQNGKYVQYWKDNFLGLLGLFQILANNEVSILRKLYSLQKGYASMLVNLTKNTADSNELDSLLAYKTCTYSTINTVLSDLKKNPNTPISQETRNHIERISNFLDSQVLSEEIHVYRSENLDILNGIILENGKTLSETLAYLDKKKDQKRINEIIEEVKKNNYIVHQERFMSTSLERGFLYKDINWDLTIPAGTKGAYLEGINLSNTMSRESEFLLQKGCDIEITDIEYKPKNITHWQLQGRIKQTNKQE